MIRLIAALTLPFLAAGCAAPLTEPELMASRNPADARQITTTAYQPVVTGYTHRDPVEPLPWRQQNDEQAPVGGAGS